MFIRKENITGRKYSKITHLGGTLSHLGSSKVFQPIRIEIDNSKLPKKGDISVVKNTAIIIVHELKSDLDTTLDVIKVLHKAELTSAINFICLNNDKLCIGVIHELWTMDNFSWYLKKINNVLQKAQIRGVMKTITHGTNTAAYEGMGASTSELFTEWLSEGPTMFLDQFQDSEGLIHDSKVFDDPESIVFNTAATMHG